jgi:hypothetical protein
MIFIDGSLNVLTTSIPVILSGSGPSGSFTMPAEDVGLYADFRQTVLYVRQGGAGLNNGTSWENASGDLQEMMNELGAIPGYTGPRIVKVGAGTYKPQYKPNSDSTVDYTTPANDRDSAFLLRKGVQVLGGYPAGGGDSRNVTGNVTTLSGDFLGNDMMSGTAYPSDTQSFSNNGENAYHVVLAVGIPLNSGTVLDGLTIKGGYSSGGGDITVGSGAFNRQHGGGIYMINASPVLTNLTICENWGNDRGGGIYNTAGSSPVLSSVKIFNNRATSGGGMYNDGTSSMVLSKVTISGNRGTSGSGGMSNINSSLVLTDVTISGNNGVGNGGGMYNISSSLILTNVMISGNGADTHGGGIYNGGSSLTLTNVIISNNTVGNNGGGIANYSNSLLALVNVTIAGNTANGNGGGMYNEGSSLALVNVTISGNTANEGGGMFNIVDSSPVLTNVTVAGNYAATGGGIFTSQAGSLPKIRNSVIWGNTAGTDPNISNGGSAGPEFTYSIVQGSGGSGSWIPATGTNGGNNKDADPSFISPNPAGSGSPKTGGDYRLGSSDPNPAVDAGSDSWYPDNANDTSAFPIALGLSTEEKAAINAALLKDLGGNIRTQGGTIDMGAYERQ